MIIIELNGKDYELPQSYGDINIRKYMDIMSIDTELTETEKNVSIISILTGIEKEDVLLIKMDHLKLINTHLSFLMDKSESILVDKIEIDDKWYGLHDKLDTMSIGQHIDMESFSGAKTNEKLDYLMAILYRPIKKKKTNTLKNFVKNYIYNKGEDISIEDYDITTLKERADIFKEHMNMDIVLGSLFFFSILSIIYVENIESSTPKKSQELRMVTLMKEMGITFMKNGVG